MAQRAGPECWALLAPPSALLASPRGTGRWSRLVFSLEPPLWEGETIPGRLLLPLAALLWVSKQTSQRAFEAASKATEGLGLGGGGCDTLRPGEPTKGPE